jgi:hypothetical protein
VIERGVDWVRGRIDWWSDAGYAAGGEVIPFGVLIFVMGTLMVTNLWGVIDLKMATDGAAREGARLVAESDGPGSSPALLGIESARASILAHQRDPARVRYDVGYGVDTNADGVRDGRWAPCTRVVVTVEYPLKLINLPLLGVAFGNEFTVTSTHSEIIDPYRSRAADPGPLAC